MHPIMLFVIVAALAALITIMQLRVRVQRLATYWIEPLVLLVLCWIVIDDYTHWHMTSHLWYLLGTIAGIVIGLFRGRATKVELGEKPGTFTVQGSWITIFLLLLITGTNIAARIFLHGQTGVNIQQATSPLILVTAFNIITWRVVMWVKYLNRQREAPTKA
jgi:hypothetical protein